MTGNPDSLTFVRGAVLGGMIRDVLNSGSKWARLAAEIVLDKIQGDLSSENQELKKRFSSYWQPIQC
jgi:hypothetical protein